MCLVAVWMYLDNESKESVKENEVKEIVFNQSDSLLFFDAIPDNTVEVTPDIEEIEVVETVAEPKKRGRRPKVV